MEEDSFVESIDSLIKTIKDLIVRPIQRFTGFASLGLLLVVLLLTALVFLFMGVLKIMQGLGVLLGVNPTGFALCTRFSFFNFVIKQLQEEKKCLI